eukprot:2138604-Rhodomonas_salina.1
MVSDSVLTPLSATVLPTRATVLTPLWPTGYAASSDGIRHCRQRLYDAENTPYQTRTGATPLPATRLARAECYVPTCGPVRSGTDVVRFGLLDFAGHGRAVRVRHDAHAGQTRGQNHQRGSRVGSRVQGPGSESLGSGV